MSDGFDAALDAYSYDHAGDDGGLAAMYDDDDLELVIDDWLEGETIAERNARIRARDAATADRERHDDRGRDVDWDAPAWERAEGWDDYEPARDPAPIPRPRRPELRGGRALVTQDVATARAFIRGRSIALGFGIDELLERAPRGRPTLEAKRRRDALAAIVAELRADGATIETLAAAAARTVSVVHDLLSVAAKSEKATPIGDGRAAS